MQFVVHHATPTQLVATAPHLLLRIVDGHQTQIEDLQRIEAVVTEQFGDTPLFGTFQLVLQGSPTPNTAVRRHSAQLMEAFAERSVVVVALLGLGFWASTFRTASNTFMTLLRRSSIHFEISLEQGAELLARELVGLNADELVAACKQLLEHMHALSD